MLIDAERSEKTTVTTTSLIEQANGPLVVTNDQLALVKRTVANGATEAELKLYLYDCARQGVHPLDRLLHFTKRGGRYTPVTSIDLMRIRAAETGEYAGSDDALFDADRLPQKLNEPPSGARVTVWRLVQGTRCAFTATARWAEYYPGDASGTMWRKMPHTMLAKCAEALALRKGFPRQLAGLYATEELDQADAKSVVLVEAPSTSTSPLSADVPPPPTERGGDAQGRPSGAESSGDAALSPDTLPEMVNQETGEVLLLPDGVVLITRVLAGKGAIKLSINHSGQLPGDNAIAIFKEQLATVATEVAQTHVPVRLEIAKSAKGNDYVKDIHAAPLPESWQANTAQPTDADPAGHGEPVDLDQIPF
jgi:phage recombination protein Bet